MGKCSLQETERRLAFAQMNPAVEHRYVFHDGPFNKSMSVFHAFVLLLIMNFVIMLSK